MSCEFGCGPLRMPQEAYEKMVSNRPQIIPLSMRASAEKFQKYKDLKETATSERDRPSYKPATDASRAAKQEDKKTQQETGITYHAKSARDDQMQRM